jgi:hypothetical protein
MTQGFSSRAARSYRKSGEGCCPQRLEPHQLSVPNFITDGRCGQFVPQGRDRETPGVVSRLYLRAPYDQCRLPLQEKPRELFDKQRAQARRGALSRFVRAKRERDKRQNRSMR